MRRIARLIPVAVVALLVIGAVGYTGFEIVAAADDLRDAENLVDSAATALQEGRIADAANALDRAENLLLDANESLQTSVGLDVVGLVPIARNSVRGLEESIDLATKVVHGGGRIIGTAGPLQSPGGTLEVSLSDGTLPLDAVSAAQDEIARLVDQLLLTPPLRTSRFLPGPIKELREKVTEEAQRRSTQLGVLDRGLSLLEEMAGGNGPRRYLLAVANTAEMRGSGGMILNYGVLEGVDGTLDLTEFGRIDEVALTEPVSEDLVPADYLARWTGFQPLTRWRQANLSADLTVTAPVLEEMYQAATDLPVNGVIQVDPEGLAAVLDGVGAVQVPELGEVNGDNVVNLTMNEAYVRFPGVEERSDVLGDVAEAAFTRLVEGEVPSLRTLATRLAEAVAGRHILMHSTAPQTQRDIVAFGADGALPPLDGPDSLSLTVQNLTGNKLDYYLDSSVELRGDRNGGEIGTLEATIALTNTAAAGATEPRYIFGPGFVEGAPPAGVIRSLTTLYLPLGTEVEAIAGDPTVEPPTSGTEAGRPYVTFTADVPAAQTRAVKVSLRLAPRPPDGYRLLIVPSPRIRPTTFDVELSTSDGPISAQLAVDRTWILAPAREPVAEIPIAYR